MATWVHPRGRAGAGAGRDRRGGSRLTALWPLGAYLGLVLALFVRFTDPATARPPLHLEATRAHVRLVRRQHRTFYAILIAAPIEWLLRGRPSGWTALLGAVLFLAGVWCYRRTGRALVEQLSQMLAPREPAILVEGGPYRHVRHPMYLAELAMAFGAPLTLGAWATAMLALPFTMSVVWRIGVEEAILQERMPGYRAYMERTHRLIPHVY